MSAIDAGQLVERARFNAFHISLIIFGFLIIMVDGYDIVIYGSVVPVLMKEWSISSVTAGAIASYTTLGMAVGTVAFGFAADKVGRKKIIMLCIALFSVFTPLAGFANSPVLFTLFRILAGIGLGGVMPNVIALSTEYAPKSLRVAIVSFIFCGYSIGGILAGLVSRSLIPTVGWRPVFWLSAIALLLLPILAAKLPESYRMLMRRQNNEQVRKILRKVNPEYPIGEVDKFETMEEAKVDKLAFKKLFEQKRAFSTVMFWLSSLSCFILISTLSTWLPGLMMQAGYDLSSSLQFAIVANVGAILGTIIFGRLTDRWGFKKVVLPLYLCGALALALIGFTKNIWIIYLLIAIVGTASIGIQNMMNAPVSQFYPAHIRSTAVGMYLAIGRIGGIIAPMLIGLLISGNLPFQMNFIVVSMACVIGAIAIMLVQEQHSYHKKEVDIKIRQSESKHSKDYLEVKKSIPS